MRRGVNSEVLPKYLTERESSTPPSTSKQLFPQMRIIQQAITTCLTVDQSQPCRDKYADDWVNYLNLIGENNYGKGHARSLGSMALTLISATEINKMLINKHGRHFQKPQEAKKIINKLAVNTRDFLGIVSTKSIENELNWEEALKVDFSNELVSSTPLNSSLDSFSPVSKNIVKQSKPKHIFKNNIYKLPNIDAIQPFSRHSFGLDLSENEQISELRHSLKKFLKEDEGLDSSLCDAKWKPHTVIFDLNDHLTIETVPSLTSHKSVGLKLNPMPTAISFSETKVHTI